MNLQTELLSHKPYLSKAALFLLKSDDGVEDLVQQVYLKAFSNIDKFEEGTYSKAWLYTILRNEFINIYRKKVARQVGIVEVYPDPELFPERPDQSFNHYGEPTYSEIVWNAIDRLTEKEYKVISLRMLEGFKYEEIADILNKPIGTIKNDLFRAKCKLQILLCTYAKQQGIKTR